MGIRVWFLPLVVLLRTATGWSPTGWLFGVLMRPLTMIPRFYRFTEALWQMETQRVTGGEAMPGVKQLGIIGVGIGTVAPSQIR